MESMRAEVFTEPKLFFDDAVARTFTLDCMESGNEPEKGPADDAYDSILSGIETCGIFPSISQMSLEELKLMLAEVTMPREVEISTF